MPLDQTNLLQGTLEMMILKALALVEMHGLGISRRIEQITQRSSPSRSSRPCIVWKDKAGWSPIGESQKTIVALSITGSGSRQLEAETKRWGRIALAIMRTLEAS